MAGRSDHRRSEPRGPFALKGFGEPVTLEGTPGESVVVDVRRGGQNVQLVMPRGPIGITGGGFRGR